MLNDTAKQQFTQASNLRARVRNAARNWLVGCSLCCAGMVSTGCSTTIHVTTIEDRPTQISSPAAKVNGSTVNPVAAQHLLNRQSANQPQVNQTAQPPTRSASAPIVPANAMKATSSNKAAAQPSVQPVSYTEQLDGTASNVQSKLGGTVDQVPAHLAGIRRSARSVASGQDCNACQDQACAGEGCAVQGSNCGECQVCLPGQRGYDAQEFICDGGDQDPAAGVRKDWSATGIDTTDTVIYYETLGGTVCVKPSNRTCVYAPRFGAVRQVTGAMFADSALSPGRVHAPVPPLGLAEMNRPSNVAQSAKIVGQRRVQLLDRLVDQQRGVLVDSVVPPTPVGAIVAPQVNADRALVDVALSREWVDLIEDRIEVITLINPESLHIEIGNQEAVAVSDVKSAAEFILYETPDGCTMRITKTASHQMASSGDRIRFTIRFENVGTQKLGNAVILDSLSPRLNYIEGSQQCSVEARFSVEPNESGSKILRWDIQSPIEGQQSGVVSFDCEVR